MGQFWSILPKPLPKLINSLIAFFRLLTWEICQSTCKKQANKKTNKPNEPFLRKKLDEWVAETTTGRSHKRTDAKKQMPWQTEYFWTKQNYPQDHKKKISSEDEYFTTFTNKVRGFLMHSGGRERDQWYEMG